ncbi:hypothetical protein ACFE04_007906 [Oxalis oulophora]
MDERGRTGRSYSPSLCGAIRINPWNIEDVAFSLAIAINMSENEMKVKHEKHCHYVKSHHVLYWVCSFDAGFGKACEDNNRKSCLPLGKHLVLDEQFFALRWNDGPRGSCIPPSREVISAIKILCTDLKNTMFIVSGLRKCSLSCWSACEKLGITAELGFFIRFQSIEIILGLVLQVEGGIPMG